MLRLLAFVFAAFVSCLSPALAETLVGRVVGVSDGDTLTVLIERGGSKSPVKIRLAEIDTPERGQPWGTRAKQALSDLAYNKQVRVTVQDTDRYERKVGHVYVNGTWVNAQLIRDGHAWVYRKYSRSPELLRLEEEARASRRGLWGLPESQRVPPWEWRQEQRGQSGGSSAEAGAGRSQATRRQSGADNSQCGGKSTCGQMSSCAEAKFYLNQCGVLRLDRDGDGIPCESLCR